jgi:RNA polymerase sigma-70 factor (ECF subfamily)
MGSLPKNASEWRALLQKVKRVARSSDAEELMQAAFLRMHEYARHRVVENPTAFVVRVARNLSIDAARQHRSRGEVLVETENPQGVTDPNILQDEVYEARKRLERVRLALGELSPRTRSVFLMHRVEGMKYREIAAQLQISVSAVEKHIAKAVVHLADVSDGA